jgi:hypothetical protein
MDAAEKYEKRYRAVIQKSWGACLRLSALEEWAVAKGLPISFVRAFPYVGEGEPPPAGRQYIGYSLLGPTIAEMFKECAGEFSIREYAERLGAPASDRKAAWAAMTAEIDRRILCAVFDGELTLYDSAFFPIDVAGERKNYEVFPEAYMSLDYRLSKTPAPLIAGNTMTRLDKWLELDTWTPWEAALLVTGIDPGTYQETSYGKSAPHATGLCGSPKTGEHDFLEARAVLDKWERQIDPPAKVTPAAFFEWCAAKGINTDWLRSVAGARETSEPVRKPTAPTTNGADKSGATWVTHAREIALEYIDRHAAKDLHPSQDDVAEHTETECRARKVFGPRGPLSANTIKREAIQGEWWGENKPAKRVGKLGKVGQPE